MRQSRRAAPFESTRDREYRWPRRPPLPYHQSCAPPPRQLSLTPNLCPPQPHAHRAGSPAAPSRDRFRLLHRRRNKPADSALFPAVGDESSPLPAPNTRCERPPTAAARRSSNALRTILSSPLARPEAEHLASLR